MVLRSVLSLVAWGIIALFTRHNKNRRGAGCFCDSGRAKIRTWDLSLIRAAL